MQKILIVDDDKNFQKLLELRLTSFFEDLTCLKCNSVSEVRELLTKQPDIIFDLVILDHHLTDGLSTDLLNEGRFDGQVVLSVSSDEDPSIPGEVVKAGTGYFLPKSDISEPLLKPLIQGLMDRNRIKRELEEFKRQATVMETVRTLVGTLRHEINNPLGAVLGAVYLLKNEKDVSAQAQEAAKLVESSGKRIKHVLDELGKAISLESVQKSNLRVFHIPGDNPWE